MTRRLKTGPRVILVLMGFAVLYFGVNIADKHGYIPAGKIGTEWHLSPVIMAAIAGGCRR